MIAEREQRSGSNQLRANLIAFSTACAFCGAALYINIVEQPSRLVLDARAMVREWLPSNRRGFFLLAAFASVSAFAGYVEFLRIGDVRLLIGASIVLASCPYAFFVMTPVNILLYIARHNAPASAARDLMRDWGVLEWGQTVIGLAAALMFAWTLLAPA